MTFRTHVYYCIFRIAVKWLFEVMFIFVFVVRSNTIQIWTECKEIVVHRKEILLNTTSCDLQSKMLKSLVQSVIGCATRRNFCTNPIIVPVVNKYLDQQHQLPRQAWVDGMESIDSVRKGIIELHPSVFAVTPRIDIMHQNVIWQKKYRWVRFYETRNRAEMPGGGRKPWPQKGNTKTHLSHIFPNCI